MSELPIQPGPPMTPERAEADRSDRSVGELLADISKDLTTLMRQELDLAKAEAKQSATQAGKGIGMFAGAGVAALLFLIFISTAVWWGLGAAIGRGWSATIVAVIWAIVGAILAVVGRAEMQKTAGLSRTTDTVKKIPPALKGQERPGDTTTGTATKDYR